MNNSVYEKVKETALRNAGMLLCSSDFTAEAICSAKMSLVSPVFAADEELKGLPSAIIDTAECDNLRQEGCLYARMLEKAGVPVWQMESKGMPHGFFENAFEDLTADSMNFYSEEEKRLFREGTMQKAAEEVLAFIKKYMDRRAIEC